ncbi:MAG TPA: efflux RND transporter periplasmic adaptor subunit [Povalibacter sp.]|nr:efflux RND transporter periplasmic adaptor subunit [Povalibacter sp.]
MHITRLLPLIISLAIVTGCRSTAGDTPATPTPVRVAAAFEGPAAASIRTNGLLVNKDEIRLSFKVGGVIKHVDVREGEHVRKGQRLAEIELTEVNAQVEQARQAHEKAKRDVERGERLYTDQVISLEQLQDLRTQTAMAAAALKSARFNSSYASIIAPSDGTVLRRMAEERELVTAGTPVIVLGAQDRGFVVRIGLADREIVQLKLGDRAEVRLDALPDARIAGKVTEIASGADQASGMFMTEVALEPGSLPLKSGLVAKVTITPATASSGTRVYVPIASIVEGVGQRASVFVLDDDRVRRRDVEVAFIENDAVALADGIKPGEQIVTDGALYLEDGEQVAIQPAAEANAASTAVPSA